MPLIKLDATDSTNSELKRRMVQGRLEDGTVLWAAEQKLGRGQRGNTWLSEPHKNLTFSILKYFDSLEAPRQFNLNMAASLGIYDYLMQLGIPELKIKWPNDILSGSSKIGGILIENTLSGSMIQASVIGFGINVNQSEFSNLAHASSLSLLTGRQYDLPDLLSNLINSLKKRLEGLDSDTFDKMRPEYEDKLFKKGEFVSFRLLDGSMLEAAIVGIGKSGKLKVTPAEGSVLEFDIKEVQLLY